MKLTERSGWLEDIVLIVKNLNISNVDNNIVIYNI